MPAGHDRDREVEADDRVHRDDERRRQPGQQQVRRFVAVPVVRRAAPAHGEHAVDDAADLRLRPIAQRRQVRDQADEPEQQRHGGVRRDGEHVPDQRAPELRPDAHRVRDTGTASRRATAGPMCSSGKSPAHATANSVIASAKRLIDVRHVCLSSSRIAEMSVPAWPMPIHQTKFDDREAPGDRNVDAPDADALRPADRSTRAEQHDRERERDQRSRATSRSASSASARSR